MDIDIASAGDNVSVGLVAKCGVDAADRAQIRALADEVRGADGVRLKLNLPRPQWDPLARFAPDRVSEFCCYEDGRLVGYAPLDGDGGELEVTAAVLPSHRRQGVFRLLLGAAKREAHRRGADRLLLVGYRASLAGAAAVRALGLPYVSSEYRLEARAANLPPLDAGRVRLILVDKAGVTELARLRAMCFGDAPKSPAALLGEIDTAGARYFLAELDGELIGQIGVMGEDAAGSVYVRAFGVVPEHRRRGYGRQLLAATLRMMLSEGHTRFELDVATDNAQALSLYHACGFRETDVYDYHGVPLSEPRGPSDPACDRMSSHDQA